MCNNIVDAFFYRLKMDCNFLKMTILPKFLYLLMTLPIYIPTSFLKLLNVIFDKFLWTQKHPRLKTSMLALLKKKGGQAFPNIQKYHTAVHLTRLVDWHRHDKLKEWVILEQSTTTLLLSRLSWCPTHVPSSLKSHTLIGPYCPLGEGPPEK